MLKNLLALFVGLLFSAALLASAEFFFRLNATHNWLKKPEPEAVEINWDHKTADELFNKFQPTKNVNWKPAYNYEQSNKLRSEGVDNSKKSLPNFYAIQLNKPLTNLSRISVVRTKITHTLVYSAKFNFDEQGRRITPTPFKTDYNIILMGDSYTLGEGVDDEQSSAYQLGLLRKNAKVYNLGIPGGSASEVLYELKEIDSFRLKNIPQKKSILIYTYIDDHLERVFCRSNGVSGQNEWRKSKPYYKIENGEFAYQGDFATGRKFINGIYEIINSSEMLKFFNVVIPMSFNQNHIDFFAQMTKAIETYAKKKWPDIEFYLVLHPENSAIYGSEVAKAAKSLGINVIDYSKINNQRLTNKHEYIPIDYHPSPVLHWIFARMLDQDLPKY